MMLPTVVRSLAHFPYLKTIIIETVEVKIGTYSRFSTKINGDDAQSLVEALCKTTTVKVEHRTCDDAYDLALRAKKGTRSSTDVLSPFWCLEEHVCRHTW